MWRLPVLLFAFGWLAPFPGMAQRLLASPAEVMWTDDSMRELPSEGWLAFPGVLLDPKDATSERLQEAVKLDRYVGTWSQIPPLQSVVKGAVTYHLRLHLPGLKGRSVFLRSRDFLRSARIFINGEELIQTGKVGLTEESYIPSKAYIFQNFTAPSDDLELILQVADFSGLSGGVWAPIILYGQAAGVFQMQMDLVSFSGVLVTALFMSLYFIYLYVVYRHRRSLLYVGLFLLSMGMFIFLTGDIRMIPNLFDFLGYNIHTRAERSISVLSSLAYIMFMGELFPRDFTRRVNRIFAAVYLSIFSVQVLAPLFLVEMLSPFLGLCHLAVGLYTAIASTRALYFRRTGARLWVFGALIFLTCTLLDFGKFQALLSIPSLSHLGLLVFTFVQAMVVIQQLSEDDRQKRHAYEQLAKVFYPHQLKKMMAGEILEDTMPQGVTEACVLCFDVVSSSSLEHSEARALFGKIFSACHAALMENYHEDSMVANGYRIKEVGDGFYCSIGFPFATPAGTNPFDLALDLAFRFVTIFEGMIASQKLQRPLRCSIGLAYDTVEAYFADSGTKSYDIFGRAVILANRYEDLRRTLFDRNQQVNVIAVQEKVFQRLSPTHQSRLQPFDLGQRMFRIRDDAKAQRFFYWADQSIKGSDDAWNRAG